MRSFITCIFIMALFSHIHAHASESADWHWISPEKVYSMMEQGSGIWLVDLRNKEGFNRKHIVGAINVSSVQLKYGKYPRGKLYVLADGSFAQMMSIETAKSMIEAGYKNVYILQGGILAWEHKGLPVAGFEYDDDSAASPKELEWAANNTSSLEIYDLRQTPEQSKGLIQGSIGVPGKSIKEKIKNLKKLLADNRSLSKKLNEPSVALLILPNNVNNDELTNNLSRQTGKPLMYLKGGYEAYKRNVLGGAGEERTVGECASCGGNRR